MAEHRKDFGEDTVSRFKVRGTDSRSGFGRNITRIRPKISGRGSRGLKYFEGWRSRGSVGRIHIGETKMVFMK